MSRVHITMTRYADSFEEVEATDQEAAELSTDPADYSVYPAGEGAEIAAATDELALAA